MVMRVEYVTPIHIQFMNELDLAEQVHVESPEDQDVLVITYDEVIVIPGNYDEQIALAEQIKRAVVTGSTAESGQFRARRTTPPDVAAEQLLRNAYGLLGDGKGDEWDRNPEYTRAILELVGDSLGLTGPDGDREIVSDRIRQAGASAN